MIQVWSVRHEFTRPSLQEPIALYPSASSAAEQIGCTMYFMFEMMLRWLKFTPRNIQRRLVHTGCKYGFSAPETLSYSKEGLLYVFTTNRTENKILIISTPHFVSQRMFGGLFRSSDFFPHFTNVHIR